MLTRQYVIVHCIIISYMIASTWNSNSMIFFFNILTGPPHEIKTFIQSYYTFRAADMTKKCEINSEFSV